MVRSVSGHHINRKTYQMSNPMQFKALAALNRSYYVAGSNVQLFLEFPKRERCTLPNGSCRTLPKEMYTRNTQLLDDNFRFKEQLARIQTDVSKILPDFSQPERSEHNKAKCTKT